MTWFIDLAALALRLVAGVGFMFHGRPKLFGESRKQTIGYMKSVGIPSALTISVAILEFIGGLFLILGVLTRLTSGLLALEMIGTTILSATRLKKKYILGYELDTAYFAIFLSVALLGAGVYSLDNLFGIKALPFVA